VVVAVMLVAGTGYGNYVLISSQDERVQVLVLARDVPWGQPIRDADLAVAQAVSDPQVRMIPAASRASVVGKVAATNLAEGGLLQLQDITVRPVPGRGEQIFGLLCKPGTVPAHGIRPGDPVAVTPTAGPGFRARVADVAEPDASGSVLIDLIVPTDRAADAAAAASGSVISLLGPDN
jgi:Flp pilus assembly protein CpaB